MGGMERRTVRNDGDTVLKNAYKPSSAEGRTDVDKEHGAFAVPESIRKLTAGKAFSTDGVGMSKAQVMVFEDCVLKIVPYREKNEETVRVMRWLENKLPVPKVLCYECDGERQYLLMSRLPGRMACDAYYLERPDELAARLAEAIRMLWSIDVSDCPRVRDLDTELREARFRVENNLVNLELAEPATFGPGGFKDPEHLLDWLERNRPGYEPALSHGDLCLPNILIDNGRISGLIDLGDTGIGDRWRDIALCWRSMRRNAEGAFGGKVYPDARAEMLFDALGVKPDAEKLRYYLLLDELF